jgi:CDP-diacylglycerol--glycerol-3-phosphate 3-phosphatidyltransferase
MGLRRPLRLDETLTIPNVVTVFRIAMAVVAAVLFVRESAQALAVILCVAAALLDVFDGWYARTFEQCSHLGEHLDPLADKLLMAVVYVVIGAGIGSRLVWTLIGLIALRELAMTVFRSYSLRRHRRFIPANGLGKVKMVLQSTVGLGILAYAFLVNGGFDLPQAVVVGPLVVILFVSYVSAFVYIRRWRSAGRLAVAGRGSAGFEELESSRRMVVGK